MHPDAVTWAFLVNQELVLEVCRAKIYFFTFYTFDVSEIFCKRVVQPRSKYSYCIFLKELCLVSVCWILNNALAVFHVLCVFWFLYCVQLYHQYLAPYVVLSSKYILLYNVHGVSGESII